MDKFNSQLFQRRFDVAIGELQLVFTDLLILTETISERLHIQEKETSDIKERVTYLETVISKMTGEKNE